MLGHLSLEPYSWRRRSHKVRKWGTPTEPYVLPEVTTEILRSPCGNPIHAAVAAAPMRFLPGAPMPRTQVTRKEDGRKSQSTKPEAAAGDWSGHQLLCVTAPILLSWHRGPGARGLMIMMQLQAMRGAMRPAAAGYAGALGKCSQSCSTQTGRCA